MLIASVRRHYLYLFGLSLSGFNCRMRLFTLFLHGKICLFPYAFPV